MWAEWEVGLHEVLVVAADCSEQHLAPSTQSELTAAPWGNRSQDTPRAGEGRGHVGSSPLKLEGARAQARGPRSPWECAIKSAD